MTSLRPPNDDTVATVRVYVTSLALPPQELETLWECLDEAERARADRFRFPRHRRRFIAGRGRLREWLAALLDRPPRDLRFTYGSHGKPALMGDTSLGFNLAHSEDCAVFAVSTGREVGVDVEHVRADVPFADLARWCLSAAEQAELQSLPAEQQREAFFRGWVCKEAYIKAQGMGLSLDLGSFDVALAPDRPAAVLGTRPDPKEASRWWMRLLPAPKGFAAALAVGVGEAGERPSVSVSIDAACLPLPPAGLLPSLSTSFS